MLKTIALECKIIFKNGGVVLILILAPIIYATLYSSCYAKQVLERVPIAIVDNSHSHSSREFISYLSASPYLNPLYTATDITEAKELFYNRKIYGIVYIPKSYETDILQCQQAVVSLYCDASYFLMYRQVFQGVVGVISTFNREIGIEPAVDFRSHNLFNPYLGYGTFIMPAILVVILQQTLLMGIGVVGGIWSRRRLYKGKSVMQTIVSKAIVYGAIYAVIAAYILTIHYRIFGYPTNGTIWTCIAIIFPYILSVILLAITLSTLYNRPETAIICTLWTSIPILLLSGASLPPEAFPHWMHTIGKIIPSSSAVTAFIRAQSMGADISDVGVEVIRLWALVAIYGTTSYLALKKRMSGRTTKSRTSNLSSYNDRHTLL